MPISYVPHCKKCNETLEGDGYTSVLRCPYTEEDYTCMAPDEGPVYCNFEDGEEDEE